MIFFFRFGFFIFFLLQLHLRASLGLWSCSVCPCGCFHSNTPPAPHHNSSPSPNTHTSTTHPLIQSFGPGPFASAPCLFDWHFCSTAHRKPGKKSDFKNKKLKIKPSFKLFIYFKNVFSSLFSSPPDHITEPQILEKSNKNLCDATCL